MSERTPGNGEEAMDLEVLARDDMLLDALGRGDAAPADDELATMLAAWHADLADDASGPAHLRPSAPDGDAPDSAPAVPLRPATRSRRPRPWALRLAAAAVALLALVSGLSVGSRHAEPGSPLWSLTKLLHPQQAEVRLVERAIAEARAALAAGRLDEAQRLLDRARGQLTKVVDPPTADRLRAELDALSAELAAARAAVTPTAVPATSAPTTRPTDPAPRPSTATTAPGTKPAQPETPPDPSGSPGTERSPLLPLPQLPLPEPIPSLLSPLPKLPLPTGDLLR
ncbi:hypothetical protein [Micromonospora sp. SL4-19]|uniref:hypothetical protein n=1 Tax=Micromonospora sp. SL4-19 TaxID=3399129 RepID=UPI003A4D515F